MTLIALFVGVVIGLVVHALFNRAEDTPLEVGAWYEGTIPEQGMVNILALYYRQVRFKSGEAILWLQEDEFRYLYPARVYPPNSAGEKI